MDAKLAHNLIQKHQSLSDTERQRWDKHQAWYEGNFYEYHQGIDLAPSALGYIPGTDDDINFETNYPYAFIDTMIANVCPTNPELTINARLEQMAEAAKNRGHFINDTFKRNKLHDVMWESATHASICGRGIMKTTWSERRQMPSIVALDPRAVFFDKSVPFRFTRYVIEAVPITTADFNKRRKRDSGFGYSKEAANRATSSGYPKWLKPVRSAKDDDDEARDELRWNLIYEFWDLDSGEFYHFAEGVDKPLLHLKTLPYKYVNNPYDVLVFNKSLRNSAGISDISLIAKLLERMNELDSIELNYAQRSIPITIGNKSAIQNYDAFVNALSEAGPMDVVALETREPMPINDAITSTEAPPLLVNFEVMRGRLAEAIDFTLGFPQYTRGKTNTSDVATELALVDTATRTRNGRRVKVVGDTVVSIGMKVGALWQQYLPADKAIPIRTDTETGGYEIMNREKLGFDNDPVNQDYNLNLWEETWFYDYDVVSFSPTENHRLVQLNKLQSFADMLGSSPYINQAKFMRKTTELLGMEELFDANGGAQAQQAAQAQAAAQTRGGQLPSGTPGDVIATGGMPEGMDHTDLTAVDNNPMAG